MIKKILSLAVLVLVTSSCSIYHISSTNTSDDFYPQNSPENIVFLENIDQPHKVIGIVTVNSERRQSQRLNDIIEKMKREAAILGGDAITEIKTDATGPWKHLPAQQMLANGYVRANFTASVVVFE